MKEIMLALIVIIILNNKLNKKNTIFIEKNTIEKLTNTIYYNNDKIYKLKKIK